MIARATSCVGLSLGIAGVAAVALHRPDLPGPVPRNIPAISSATPPNDSPPAARPQPTPVVAWDEPPPIAPRPIAGAQSVRPTVRPPRPDSTRVKPGETLADVANRIYGPGVDLSRFWGFNRDQIVTQETPLKPGMLLRTPDLGR